MAGSGMKGGQRGNLSSSSGRKQRSETSTSHKGSRVDPSHVTEQAREMYRVLSATSFGMIGPRRQEEVKAVGNRRGVRDGRSQPPRGEQVPQGHLTPHPVPVGVDVRRERDTPAGSEHGGDGFGGTHAFRGNGYFVRGHGMQNNERRRAKTSSGETLHIGVARRRRATP